MPWTLDNSKLVYGIGQKDLHYLDINEEGKLTLSIQNQKISFENIIHQFCEQSKKVNVSFTLRIPQLITEQISKLFNAFKNAREQFNYTGKFYPIYPIKVNHTKMIIETIIKAHPTYGFESGTKSEFILLQEALKNEKQRLIMCNGAKDREFLTTIKNAISKGFDVCVSIESVQELKDTLDILPRKQYQIAFRIKPYLTLRGHWGASCGRNSKFGLSIGELVDVAKILKENNATHLLTTLHAHPGSQITSLEDIKDYAKFMAGIFTNLHNLGFTNLKTINFGGGLPIDYDNRLDSDFMEKYANILTSTLSKELPEHQPTIIIEAGRAITALYSIIVVKTIDFYEVFPKTKLDDYKLIKYKLKAENFAKANSSREALKNWEKWEKNKPILNDVSTVYEFETLTYWLKKKLREIFFSFNDFHQFIDDPLFESLMKPEFTLQGNFSVFNSICDLVLVHQYFPVIPINNLQLQPESIIRLLDITCDSDGEVAIYNAPINDEKLFTKDNFLLTYPKPISLQGFPVGKIEDLKDGYLVIPLAGAYQDIIEFDHNLLGDLPDVLIAVDSNGWIIQPMNGAQSIRSLLNELGFECVEDDDPYYDKGEKETH